MKHMGKSCIDPVWGSLLCPAMYICVISGLTEVPLCQRLEVREPWLPQKGWANWSTLVVMSQWVNSSLSLGQEEIIKNTILGGSSYLFVEGVWIARWLDQLGREARLGSARKHRIFTRWDISLLNRPFLSCHPRNLVGSFVCSLTLHMYHYSLLLTWTD